MSKITKKIDGLITENEVKHDLSNDRKEQERLFWERRAYRKVRSLIEKTPLFSKGSSLSFSMNCMKPRSLRSLTKRENRSLTRLKKNCCRR